MKAAVLGFVLLALTACGASLPTRAETVRAANTFQCEVNALTPYVPAVLDVGKLVEEVKGQVELQVVLMRLGASKTQAEAAIDALNACIHTPAVPDAGAVPS